MSDFGHVRFDRREGWALVYALGRGACETDPGAESLSIQGLVQRVVCLQAGGLEAFRRLPPRAQQQLVKSEMKAIRGALARLGDLGLVVWDLAEENGTLAYRLTELGWQTAICFGRRTQPQRPAGTAVAAGG